MPTLSQVMTQLKAKGSAQTRKTFARHGAPTENMFGVKVADLKVIAKTIKGQQQLGLELFDTGNADAMYLAGMIVDGSQMKKAQLEKWAKQASWYMISEHAVPGVVCENPIAHELALKWIDSKKQFVAGCGWNTYAGLLALIPNEELNLAEIKTLMKRIVETIHNSPNRVRYTMNGFIISVGTYVTPLLKEAKAAAKKIGQVSVEMGETSCQVPLATDYIAKIEKMGRIGKKRKSTKCSGT